MARDFPRESSPMRPCGRPERPSKSQVLSASVVTCCAAVPSRRDSVGRGASWIAELVGRVCLVAVLSCAVTQLLAASVTGLTDRSDQVDSGESAETRTLRAEPFDRRIQSESLARAVGLRQVSKGTLVSREVARLQVDGRSPEGMVGIDRFSNSFLIRRFGSSSREGCFFCGGFSSRRKGEGRLLSHDREQIEWISSVDRISSGGTATRRDIESVRLRPDSGIYPHSSLPSPLCLLTDCRGA